jgi:hypothetical protein
MSIWDGDRGPLNIPFPTMGGEVFWEDLDCRGQYRLQQNKITKHCRILDYHNIRVAWGEEGTMRAKLRELTEDVETAHARYGDVIGIHRLGGIYDHYGVYESDNCIYEYAAQDGDFGGKIDIHITTLSKFTMYSGNYFILAFPEKHGKPGKMNAQTADLFGMLRSGPNPLLNLSDIMENLVGSKDYHLYSPEETIQRAKSRLGETQYNLIENNCENFAIWCKTGISESHQVDALLRILNIY